MTDNEAFQPDWVSAPGETIRDILEQKKMSVHDFAQGIGKTLEQAGRLLAGWEPVTPETALKLQSVLGGSTTFWTTREKTYREGLRNLERQGEDKNTVAWLKELPVTDMIKFGWLYDAKTPNEKIGSCLKFFGVNDVATWRNEYSSVLKSAVFRTSATFRSEPTAVAAWLRRGELESASVEADPWDPIEFLQAVNAARKLTREADPQVFIPKLRQLFAACGVAVIVLRAPSGCRASGATRFLTSKKALLLLSVRYLSDDQFWFSVFHEAGHLYLHPQKLMLDTAEMASSREEDEANQFAANTLVPKQYRSEMLELPLDGRMVMRFARKIGIAPGLVVGQLQHLGILEQRQLNNLKRQYKWNDE
jgi:Zn-dependent peptidase ImmA (M78 family)/plasmid maintenance system antidote protein VapI